VIWKNSDRSPASIVYHQRFIGETKMVSEQMFQKL